jgi:hypothetical protein
MTSLLEKAFEVASKLPTLVLLCYLSQRYDYMDIFDR